MGNARYAGENHRSPRTSRGASAKPSSTLGRCPTPHPPGHARRGAPRRRAPRGRHRAHGGGTARAHPRRARRGLRGARGDLGCAVVGLRLGPHGDGAPRLRARARDRAAPRRGRLRDHHRRRPGHHGGRQPRRAGRPARRASASTSSCRSSRREPLPGHLAALPLLLHAQGHVRALRERVRRVPRRLRDPRRAVRGAPLDPDRQDPPLPGRPRAARLLGRPARLAARAAARRGQIRRRTSTLMRVTDDPDEVVARVRAGARSCRGFSRPRRGCSAP